MCSLARKIIFRDVPLYSRSLSVTSSTRKKYSCKLLVVGGGTGGCTIAAKFARRLGKDAVIVLEPSSDHYYQPLFTLVGAGVKRVSDCWRSEKSVLPKNALWLQDAAETIDPEAMSVTTKCGNVIDYSFIVLAVGMKYDYDKVPGLSRALNDKRSCVSTIYSPDYCEKTWSDLQKFKGGDAVFTYPDTPIKCPGAPQKIVYMADAYFRKINVRSQANIVYNTCLPVIFGVKKYADALLKVVERKKIQVNYQTVLKAVKPESNEAIFVSAADKGQEVTIKYNLLHVTPPMSPPECLSCNEKITDKAGYLNIDIHTLQHVKYKNMFGIGDCTNTPNSKTAAAIAKQCYVLEKNLISTMNNDSNLRASYDGYGACPLLTSYNTCILAEFIYNGVPRETLPFNQAREMALAYYMKKDLFPFIYWNMMLKGYYHGPEGIRKIINPFSS